MTDEKTFFNSIREILQLKKITREERQIIDGWREHYSNSEISEALKKAVENHARTPIGKYTTMILEENRTKQQRGQNQKNQMLLPRYMTETRQQEDLEDPQEELSEEDIQEIEDLLLRIQKREEMYLENGYAGYPQKAERQLGELRYDNE